MFFEMKNLFLTLTLMLFFVGCGEKKDEKKGGFTVVQSVEKDAKKETQEAGVPVDMKNVGIGPVKEYSFTTSIDKDKAALGEAKFKQLCVACHMAEQRMIGPALKGVYDRRNPAWVLNMIMNPTEMIQKDPIGKALLKEYNNAVMLNQNVSKEDAEAIAEYLRTL